MGSGDDKGFNKGMILKSLKGVNSRQDAGDVIDQILSETSSPLDLEPLRSNGP